MVNRLAAQCAFPVVALKDVTNTEISYGGVVLEKPALMACCPDFVSVGWVIPMGFLPGLEDSCIGFHSALGRAYIVAVDGDKWRVAYGAFDLTRGIPVVPSTATLGAEFGADTLFAQLNKTVQAMSAWLHVDCRFKGACTAQSSIVHFAVVCRVAARWLITSFDRALAVIGDWLVVCQRVAMLPPFLIVGATPATPTGGRFFLTVFYSAFSHELSVA